MFCLHIGKFCQLYFGHWLNLYWQSQKTAIGSCLVTFLNMRWKIYMFYLDFDWSPSHFLRVWFLLSHTFIQSGGKKSNWVKSVSPILYQTCRKLFAWRNKLWQKLILIKLLKVRVNTQNVNVWFHPLPSVSGESPRQPLPPYNDPNVFQNCGGLGMCLLQKHQLERELQQAAGATIPPKFEKCPTESEAKAKFLNKNVFINIWKKIYIIYIYMWPECVS